MTNGQLDMKTEAAPNAWERTGAYPKYHALWHLKALGVVSNLDEFQSVPWNLAQERLEKAGVDKTRTRVALIDTAVYWAHPNLASSINRALSIDFSAYDQGSFQVAAEVLDRAELDQRKESRVEAVDGASTPSLFAGHGTAMAGLIGARPVDGILFHKAEERMQAKEPASSVRMPLPYTGIDPFCEIVSIATSATPEPDEMIRALLYAETVDADLIVFAAELAEPDRLIAHYDNGEGEAPLSQQAQSVPLSSELRTRWDDLRKLLLDVSQRRIILCAAGNSADDIPAYPASLAARDNGLIAVGSWTGNGQIASYSPGQRDGLPVSCFAFSGDSPRVDRDQLRLDPYAPRLGQPNRDELYAVQHSRVAVEDLISTDVPGRFGYNASTMETSYRLSENSEDQEVFLDFAALFCRFSGTSGATAVAAGLLSLAYSSGIFDRSTSVIELKRRFLGADVSSNVMRGNSTSAALPPLLGWSFIKEAEAGLSGERND